VAGDSTGKEGDPPMDRDLDAAASRHGISPLKQKKEGNPNMTTL
jgi:hypothetical protein